MALGVGKFVVELDKSDRERIDEWVQTLASAAVAIRHGLDNVVEAIAALGAEAEV